MSDREPLGGAIRYEARQNHSKAIVLGSLAAIGIGLFCGSQELAPGERTFMVTACVTEGNDKGKIVTVDANEFKADHEKFSANIDDCQPQQQGPSIVPSVELPTITSISVLPPN